MTRGQADRIREIARSTFRDTSHGHGIDHLLRVEAMAVRFLPDGGDRNIASAVALLHDADDYKLHPPGTDLSELPFATGILVRADIAEKDIRHVSACIHTIGYSKRMSGTVPSAPEAMAVSDADMCDILGVDGLMRLAAWQKGDMAGFFDPDRWPAPDMTMEEYRGDRGPTSVQHMFEKVLKLPTMMMTEAGEQEAWLRWSFSVQALRELFRERSVPEWNRYLYRYIENRCKTQDDTV